MRIAEILEEIRKVMIPEKGYFVMNLLESDYYSKTIPTYPQGEWFEIIKKEDKELAKAFEFMGIAYDIKIIVPAKLVCEDAEKLLEESHLPLSDEQKQSILDSFCKKIGEELINNFLKEFKSDFFKLFWDKYSKYLGVERVNM